MNVTPAGIGFVVLLGTMLGLMVNYRFDLSIVDFYFVIGAIHGCMASLVSWAAFSAYEFFFATRARR